MEYAKRMAATEAAALGLAAYGVHSRPDGAAPAGKTWSYAFGEWKDIQKTEVAAKKIKTEQTGGAAGPSPPCCMMHGTRPIDVWYDCQKCLVESDDWAKASGFTHCVSAHNPSDGTDKGAWVTRNAGRWRF